jgi:asparagine N-glycosylation enzyme membrane subunit Stt3
MLIGGGVIVLLALTAMTYADRRWAQFSLLTAVAAIILSAILLIATLQKPFQSDAIKISSGPMTAALATVGQGLPPQSC